MANSEYNYIPTYIRRTINNRPKDVVTSKYWNELFNLLITQGDHTAEELGNILNHFSTRLVGVESEIAESAEAIANIREVFRINVSYSGGGVYSADKTFDEIKAAYDAGQLPYVVDGTTSNSDTIYTLDLLLYDESSAQGFADFRRHLISKNAAHTETLRIYSHTLASGSNIELQTERFNVPNGTTYVKVSSAGGVITTVNGETYSDIKTLINAGKPVVVRYNDVLDFYYFETFEFSDSSGTHKRLNFRCVMGSIVYTLTLRDDNTWAFSETSLQTSSITDSGGYFTTDTVEGALQEIGAGLAGGVVKSVNGQTGVVVLDADAVGAQKPLIAGSGITIIPSDNGDIIQSNASGSCGNGLVSFVDAAGGAPIASFTLNQMQDCEINVNDLTAHLHNNFVDLETSDRELALSLSNNYRTAAAQDVIDNTKLTDAPTDGKEYVRKNGSWSEVAVVDVGVESVNGKTGVVTLNATEIPSTKLAPTNVITFLIDGAFDEALVELTLNGASASANDFISAINSGATVTVGLNDQGNPKVTFDDRPVKYKITNDTLSLCFIAEKGHTYTPAIYVLSGPTSGTGVSNLVEHRFTDSLYQEHYVSANDLPVQAPLSVEQYLEALEARIAALENP